MSVRVHVIGAFGITEAELRVTLKQIGESDEGDRPFRMGSSGAWAWACASVWQVASGEIDEALCTLNGPALRVTSSDGVLWMLTLAGGGHELFRGVHHFVLVGSEPPDPEDSEPEDSEPEDSEPEQDDEFPDVEIDEVAGINRFIPELQFLWDAEEEARIKMEIAEEEADDVEGLDDYTDYGVQLPRSTIADMKQQPHNACYLALTAHGLQIVDALERFGFEFDRDKMFKLLTTGPLTSREQDSDVGNMPRFLEYLGIEGVFAESAEDCDVDDGDAATASIDNDEEEQELDEEPAEEVARFEEMMQQLSNAAEQMQEAAKVPHRAELLHKGRTGGFYRASFADLKHVSPEQLRRIDEAVAALGFQFVVDSVGDVDQQQEISRLYISKQAIALHGRRNEGNEFGWAPVSDGAVLVDLSGGTTEFHTHFEDGSIFVTTTVDAVKSKPQLGIYVRSYEDVSVEVLWHKHCDGVQHVQGHRNTSPVDHLPFADATRLLKRMDNLFVRFMEMDN